MAGLLPLQALEAWLAVTGAGAVHRPQACPPLRVPDRRRCRRSLPTAVEPGHVPQKQHNSLAAVLVMAGAAEEATHVCLAASSPASARSPQLVQHLPYTQRSPPRSLHTAAALLSWSRAGRALSFRTHGGHAACQQPGPGPPPAGCAGRAGAGARAGGARPHALAASACPRRRQSRRPRPDGGDDGLAGPPRSTCVPRFSIPPPRPRPPLRAGSF